MNKAVKISLISLLSILVVLLIAISMLLWMVFTPSKLTSLVQNQAADYISCKTEIGKAELTFFSTFPQLQLKVEGMKLIHPVEGGYNDTLLTAGTAYFDVDIKKLLQKNELDISGVKLTDVQLNAFVDQSGKPNYDVFITDTTSQDTSAFENPFRKIDIRKIELRNADVSYVDLSSDMKAHVRKLNGDLSFVMIGNKFDAKMNAFSPDMSFYMDSIDYLKKSDVKIQMPFSYDMDKQLFTFDNTRLVLNKLKADASGLVQMYTDNDNIFTDIRFSTKSYPLKPLIDMIPPYYTTSLEGMTMDGIINSTGTVKGIFNEKSMPLIVVDAQIKKGTYTYTLLPYKLFDIAGRAEVRIDLNNEAESKIILKDVKAKTGLSRVEASGSVKDILLDDMLFDLDLKMELNLPELDPMMPDGMDLHLFGFANGIGNIKFRFSDAMNFDLQKMNISGKFDATNLGLTYDSLSLYSDKAKLDITIPNNKTLATQFMDASMWCDKLKYQYGKNMSADILNANMFAQTSDLTHTDQMNTIDCIFNFDGMAGEMDGMQAYLDKSKGNMLLKMNFSDSIATPDVVCDFDVTRLKAMVDDSTSATISYPKGRFKMYGEKNHPDKPVFDIVGTTGHLTAVMGSQHMSAQHANINTNVVYDYMQKSAMLQWLPTGDMALYNGKITIDGIKPVINIPTIQLEFTPDMYNIKDSRMVIDNSDFHLAGKLWNVDEYLKDKGLLKGEFNFNSKITDVYELMAMTSGLGEHDTTAVKTPAPVTTTDTVVSSGPYMVPKGMDIKLHANIDQALLGFDTARNVLGDLYIKDGLLVLEDMRFVSSAAKMQLTCMYRTPRANHLFAGVDFHMTDMEIGNLISMFPQVDTIMPMLKSFRGKGEFHFVFETYLDSLYNLKKSTLRGASSIKGENLVLMDGETFTEIAKMLRFNKKAVNKVDSMAVEFTILKKNIDVYPFLIVMDKYKAVVDGRQDLDMHFNYHISVTDSPLPIKFGVNINGTMDEIMNSPMKCIKPAPCKYANLYRPSQRREVDSRKLEIKEMIRKALTSEVIKQ
jgi:hypothetical protein